MQRLTKTLLCATTMITALAAQRGGRGERELQAPELKHFTFENGKLETKTMQSGEARYYILLPKGHGDEANKDTLYPWILWLPGFGGPEDFLNRGGAAVLDQLRGEGKIPPLAVAVYVGGRSTYMNGERAGRTEDLIVGDLPAHLQKTYRLSDQRGQRALMGVSAGGFGALKIAMRHPEVFGTVAVHSAAILPADPGDLAGMNENVVQRFLRGGIAEELGDPIDKAKWAAMMPMALAASKKPEDLEGLQIYFAAGTEDNYGFFEPNAGFDQALTANGHAHFFHKIEEGGHAWSSAKMREGVAVSLQFVGAALQGKDAVAATKALLAPAKK